MLYKYIFKSLFIYKSMNFKQFILGVMILLVGCLDSNQPLNESEKARILDSVKKLIILSTPGLNPNDVSVILNNYEYKSGIIVTNLTIKIQSISQNVEVSFTKDLKYILVGLVDIDSILQQPSLLENDPQVKNYLILPNLQDTPYKGNKNAKIILIEFSDFECPFCKRFTDVTLPKLISDWIDTGKMVMYYIHFPLNFHPKAEPAARASYCAYKQDKFWEYHDLMFSNINSINNNLESYLSLAKQLGLDEEEFKECFNSPEASNKVQEDLAYSLSIGVRGTPSFLLIVDKSVDREKVVRAASFVQGEVRENDDYYAIFFSGALPYNSFNQLLTTLET